MTNRTAEPAQHDADDAPPPGHAGVSRQPDVAFAVSDGDRSIRHASLVAGVVYAGVLLVAVSELVAALRLLGDDAYLAVFSTDQLQAHALLRIEA